MNAALRAAMAHHSKSFSLASRLLDGPTRDDVTVLYAWCRRADDEVDLAPLDEQSARVERLHAELGAVYAGEPLHTPLLSAFQSLVHRRHIPKEYPLALLAGMLRSLDYARHAALNQVAKTAPEMERLVGPSREWLQRARAAFLDAYGPVAQAGGLYPADTGFAGALGLLRLFEIEKALYELRYELNNRPDWIGVPLAGIAELAGLAPQPPSMRPQ